jgi:hypothetical protein
MRIEATIAPTGAATAIRVDGKVVASVSTSGTVQIADWYAAELHGEPIPAYVRMVLDLVRDNAKQAVDAHLREHARAVHGIHGFGDEATIREQHHLDHMLPRDHDHDDPPERVVG